MRIIRFRGKSFDLDNFLKKPLFAHLSTMSEEGPRDSPVWFHGKENGYGLLELLRQIVSKENTEKSEMCNWNC